MFCGKCGSPIPDGNSFCAQCGTPIPDSSDQPLVKSATQPVQPVPVVMMTQAAPIKRTNGVAIAGFVLGIFATVFCIVPGLGMILGIVGLILSIIGITKKKSCGSGGGLAITGLILSVIGIMGLILALGINSYTRKAQAYSQSAYETTVDPKVDEVNKAIDSLL